MDKYCFYYQVLDQAESFNCGEPLIEMHTCESLEEVDKGIEGFLREWPWCGYWVIKENTLLTIENCIRYKEFDYEGFIKAYYEDSVD